jgi:hypothetical protein
LPEAVVLFLVNQTKAGRLIDAAGGDQHVVRPQRDLAITGSPREANAFADKTAPNPEASCLSALRKGAAVWRSFRGP